MVDYAYEMIRENAGLPARFGSVRSFYTTFPAHWHEYVEIIYLNSGHMTAVIQAEQYELSVGDILVINSDDIHMTRTAGEKTEYTLLQISPSQIAAFFPNLKQVRFATWIPAGKQMCAESAKLCREQNHDPSKDGILQKLLLEMKQIYEQKEDGYSLLFSARLYEFLYLLYRDYARRLTLKDTSNNHRNFKQIVQVLEWAREHYTEPLTIEEAAAYLGFSREYFCRLFKKHTGQTFLSYVNELRAMKLYEDLKQSDQSIAVLMERHGITNYKVFLHTFRKLYGDTPQRVRSRTIQDRLSESLLTFLDE